MEDPALQHLLEALNHDCDDLLKRGIEPETVAKLRQSLWACAEASYSLGAAMGGLAPPATRAAFLRALRALSEEIGRAAAP